MDDRRRQLAGPDDDDADARGEHTYPDSAPQPVSETAERADELPREPGQYVAGADGTQEITTPPAKP